MTETFNEAVEILGSALFSSAELGTAQSKPLKIENLLGLARSMVGN